MTLLFVSDILVVGEKKMKKKKIKKLAEILLKSKKMNKLNDNQKLTMYLNAYMEYLNDEKNSATLVGGDAQAILLEMKEISDFYKQLKDVKLTELDYKHRGIVKDIVDFDRFTDILNDDMIKSYKYNPIVHRVYDVVANSFIQRVTDGELALNSSEINEQQI